jgi:hypothetical protein
LEEDTYRIGKALLFLPRMRTKPAAVKALLRNRRDQILWGQAEIGLWCRHWRIDIKNSAPDP